MSKPLHLYVLYGTRTDLLVLGSIQSSLVVIQKLFPIFYFFTPLFFLYHFLRALKHWVVTGRTQWHKQFISFRTPTHRVWG